MFSLFKGNCLDLMATMETNSIDAIVTDPPYGLSFMGKRWDYDVPSTEIWEECLRVLKPGGHLLAFGGSRTFHRMAVRIEDAGFELRDTIMWIYGSGFPKSLDVSKAIDKGQGENRARQLQFTEWMRSTGITAEQINTATNSCMASHYLTDKAQPAIATAEMFDKLRPYLPEVPEYIERLVCERTGLEWTAYKQRVVLDSRTMVQGGGNSLQLRTGERREVEVNITAPATEAAKQWHGWGTALKPAFEPIIMARKPLVGTVAQNVLEHGVGGINVDGCRVKPDLAGDDGAGNQNGAGRWPANIIHDGSEEATHGMGSAARFFYCAKASKRDRGQGNTHPTVKPTDLMRYLCRLVTPPKGIVFDPFAGSGSTGKAALLEGFGFIGAEMEEQYYKIAEARIKAATTPPGVDNGTDN